jgi:hypothetical protein
MASWTARRRNHSQHDREQTTFQVAGMYWGSAQQTPRPRAIGHPVTAEANLWAKPSRCAMTYQSTRQPPLPRRARPRRRPNSLEIRSPWAAWRAQASSRTTQPDSGGKAINQSGSTNQNGTTETRHTSHDSTSASERRPQRANRNAAVR